MNIYNYIENISDKEISEVSTLDALIFTRISYIHFECIQNQLPIKIQELSQFLKDIHTTKQDTKLINYLSKTKRFRNIVIDRCQNISNPSNDEMFTAITINLGNDVVFIAFRGTTRNIYDFKEDMNMSFKIVPSCYDALDYLEKERKKRKIYIGGHSKGGHLAMYAASHASFSVRHKIVKIYNFDGPGFLTIDKHLMKIQNKIINYFPEGSIVGRIMHNISPIIAIKTTKSGIEAHNIYNWKVENNNLVVGQLNKKSDEFHEECLKVLEVISKEKRENVINYLFTLMLKGEIKNIKELNLTKIKEIVNQAPHLLRNEKDELLNFFKIMLKCCFFDLNKKKVRFLHSQNNIIKNIRSKGK